MNNPQRMLAALAGKTVDRLPAIEWAGWWDMTQSRWQTEDIFFPDDLEESHRYLGLDPHRQFWVDPCENLPEPAHFGAPVFESRQAYEYLLDSVFSANKLSLLREGLNQVQPLHEEGQLMVWVTLEGAFWFPRKLMGIMPHLLNFYDEPEWMKDINNRLTAFNEAVIDTVFSVLKPDFFTLAEDMSYNHGPMCSREIYDRFIAPYHARMAARIHEEGRVLLIDTDGDVGPLIPWFMQSGIDGIMPLEHQAGVDVCAIRQQYPDLIMLGGFDKTVMQHGEGAMQAEFDRLAPAIAAGRYIPSVDHQTPPDVSLEQYKTYVQLLHQAIK